MIGKGWQAMPPQRLAFEQEIYEMEDLLAKLEANGQASSSEEIRRIRREIVSLKRKIYSNLTAWETVQVARHPDRPKHSITSILFSMSSSNYTATAPSAMTGPCARGSDGSATTASC